LNQLVELVVLAAGLANSGRRTTIGTTIAGVGFRRIAGRSICKVGVKAKMALCEMSWPDQKHRLIITSFSLTLGRTAPFILPGAVKKIANQF
jgi:hypothetical protein